MHHGTNKATAIGKETKSTSCTAVASLTRGTGYKGSHKVNWTIEQYLTPPTGILRCNTCGTERVGDYKQAKKGKLRCWTCEPRATAKLPSASPADAPALRKRRAPVPIPAPAMVRAELEGRLNARHLSYTRVARYQVVGEDDAPEQHVRLEVAGLRTRNPLNRRLTWQAARGLAEQVKKGTLDALDRCFTRPPEGHDYAYKVRIARIATKRGLDDDGVTAAMKAVRDAVSLFVGVNDANRRRLRVSYGMGFSVVQGVALEWTRTTGAFEDEEVEDFLLFDREELVTIALEHRAMRRYWKERRKALTTRDTEAIAAGEPEGASLTDETDDDG